MSETTEYLSWSDTAKLLRAALKAAWPGVKFSVRSSSYAGGASIDVAWTDGPTQSEVEAVAGLYAGATFDGMIDLKSHHSTLLASTGGDVRVVQFGADFVFCHRTISDALIDTYEPGIRRNARVDHSQPCDGCGNWLEPGDWFVAHTMRFESPWVAFCCSTRCAAKAEARSNVTPRPAVQLFDVVEGVGRVEFPRPLRVVEAWSELASHQTTLVGDDGRRVNYYPAPDRQPYLA